MTKKKRVLVADDDQGILDALTMMLEDAGYDVSTTPSGETLQTMKDNFPDLILLDIWMSGMDGRDVCKFLKAQEKTKNIPIIMVSANRDTEKIAKEAGANDFISKPFDMDDLLTKIHQYIP